MMEDVDFALDWGASFDVELNDDDEDPGSVDDALLFLLVAMQPIER